MLEYKVYNSVGTDYLVMIHGFGGNSSIFHKQIRYFQKHFKVVTIHLPGHGQSPCTEQYLEPLSFELVAKEIIKVLDHVRIDQAHFMGMSLGAVVVHTILKHFPERVNSTVLGGTITRFNRKSHFLIRCGKVIKSFTPHIWLYRLFAHIIMPRSNHKESRDTFVKAARKMKRTDFLNWFSIVDKVESIYRICKRTSMIPKLYLSGSEDHLFISPLQKDIQNDPNAEFILIEKCGHVCNLDKSEEFNRLALAFLQPLMDKKRIVS
ncbi:alpha/beta fold hydrolase [Rossellomorea sp. BNER]|uniref:alpha/beta fold hydrolase n=1 Tax=Rossellomorea sp. BNER TaxID=2962031 RepID=UPI003AF2DD54|nr:alpha/beta hydrolase [Rossellomorea sp. BNER]